MDEWRRMYGVVGERMQRRPVPPSHIPVDKHDLYKSHVVSAAMLIANIVGKC